MKCIRCGKDSNYKDRTNRTCAGCGGKFAFEPKQGDRITDQGFKNAIDRVNAQGSVKFTKRNLYFEVDRAARPKAKPKFILSGVLAVFAGFFALSETPAFVAAVLFLGSGTAALSGIASRFSRRVSLSWDQFAAHLTAWQSAHGPPAGLFQPRALPAGPPSVTLQAELVQYSFDRAVITDTDETADVLLANNFHFENNCAVLSVRGHPQHAFATVRDMLRNNPKIEVYALHDCTPEGCALAWHLRHDPRWFKDMGRVFDVALRPAQAEKLRSVRVPNTKAVPPGPGYTEAERRFLERHTVELASIRPEQLVKRLFRSMTRLPVDASKRAANDSGSSGGGGDWHSPAHASDGGADAFG